MVSALPLPRLQTREFSSIKVITDESLRDVCGVRMGFTGREGGVSVQEFSSLNVGSHVGDQFIAVLENRHRVLRALDAEGVSLLVPKQVHGTRVLSVHNAEEADRAQETVREGVDALVVSCEDVAAMLCFADCIPIILVAPSGAFSVVHAGWRGVVARIVEGAVTDLAAVNGEDPAGFNVYIGPHIHSCCFEVSQEVHDQFEAEFGSDCCPDETHVDLGIALRSSLTKAGVSPLRIADANICTSCNTDAYFSYRAAEGKCGRQAAVAVRLSAKMASLAPEERND